MSLSLAENQNPYYDSSKSHHTISGFTNPYISDINQKKNFSDLYKMMREPRPQISTKINIDEVDINDLSKRIQDDQNFYLWIGHSTILLHVNKKLILTDPIFSGRCSPVQFLGPERYTDPAIKLEDLPEIDIIVISHNHYDHLDYNSVKQIGDTVTWFVPLGLKKWFNENGISNVVEMDWMDSYIIDGIKIDCLPSQHWSKRTIHKSFDTLWASWLITINNFKFWFAGDTGYNNVQFKAIGQKYGPINLAAIPIGAYEPRWFMKNFHINPEEAVKIHLDVQSEQSIGIHFGTFVLTTEPVEEPAQKLINARNAYGLNENSFLIPQIGKFINL